jgi:hypothetical protein
MEAMSIKGGRMARGQLVNFAKNRVGAGNEIVKKVLEKRLLGDPPRNRCVLNQRKQLRREAESATALVIV